jgi:hypothetical protein
MLLPLSRIFLEKEAVADWRSGGSLIYQRLLLRQGLYGCARKASKLRVN